MDVRAQLVVERGARGRSVASTLRGEAPLLLRVTGDDPLEVHLVGGAAGPLGGDRLQTDVRVGAGAGVGVRSIAASLAQPGPSGWASHATVDAEVGEGAGLDWWPEPVISVAGSDHTTRTTVRVAASARVRWVDEIVLGRHLEPGGVLVAHQRFVVDGAPVLHHTLHFDPATDGIGRHGTGRVVITGIVVGTPACAAASSIGASARIARYPLGDHATAWVGLGDDLDAVRAALADVGLHRAARVMV